MRLATSESARDGNGAGGDESMLVELFTEELGSAIGTSSEHVRDEEVSSASLFDGVKARLTTAA
eukprot:3204284-Prymnesium_polylepis.1